MTISLRLSLAAVILLTSSIAVAQQKNRRAERARARDLASRENEYYRQVAIPIPPDVTLEAGALENLPDGRLAACTRRGDVYFIENALSDPPANLKFHRFASGL